MENKKEIFLESIERLKGKHSIDASAGTGKTFTLSALFLRFILEGYDVERILTLTFTKSAAEELYERIVYFLESCLKILNNTDITDENLKSVINAIINISRFDNNKKIELIKKALEKRNDINAYTIHSFCLKIVKENSFLTKVIFNSNIDTNIDELIDNAIKDYYRTFLYKIDNNLSRLFSELNIKIENFKTFYKLMNENENIIKFEIDSYYSYNYFYEKYESANKIYKEMFELISNYDSFNNISGEKKLRANSLDKLKNYYSEFKSFNLDKIKYNKKTVYNAILEFKDKGYFIPDEIINKAKKLNQFHKEIILFFYYDCYQFISKRIKKEKEKRQIIDYNDIIMSVYNNIENNELKNKLKNSFDVIMIDEFQDTDFKQYRIFESLYYDDSKQSMFLIGDKKQAIYGFRGGDIYTYDYAIKNIQNKHLLNINYRSGKILVDLIHKDLFNNIIDGFENISEIKAKKDSNDKKNSVISLEYKSYYEIENYFKRLIGFYIKEDRKLSDIAILCRRNAEIRIFKNILRKLSLPAISIETTNIFETDEALDILLLMNALIEYSNIYYANAILFIFYNYSLADLLNENNTELSDFIIYLSELYHIWENNGIFSAINRFLYEEFKGIIPISNILKDYNGFRRFTNLRHILEILHRNEKKLYLSPVELLDHYNNLIINKSGNEEFILRLDNDEDSINLVTFHSSKGLEWDVVLVKDVIPLKTKISFDEFFLINERETTKKLVIKDFANEEEENKFLMDELKEALRLSYVACTRAKTGLVFLKEENTDTNIKDSDDIKSKIKNKYFEIYNQFYEKLNSKDFVIRDINNFDEFNSKNIPSKEDFKYIPLSFVKKEYPLAYSLWSYTTLTKNLKLEESKDLKNLEILVEEESDSKETNLQEEEIFKDSGKIFGIKVHSLMEKLDFKKSKDKITLKEDIILKNNYLNLKFSTEEIEKISDLIYEILNTEINANDEKIILNNIENKYPEMPFTIKLKDTSQFYLYDQNEEILKNINGYLTGVIDLLFLSSSKYYILDWKTNNLLKYEKNYINEVMKTLHYDIQYIIYTLATIFYLKKIKVDFDYEKDFGGVIYVFLRGGKNGFFFTKPEYNLINQYYNKIFESDI